MHRDVKPSNVLVCDRGRVQDVAKLLDFGLVRGGGAAQGDGTLTEVGAVAGTPAYMSPEQAAGRPGVDGRSDVHGVGALAYFLLTGRPPFVRASAVETLAAHLAEPVAFEILRHATPAEDKQLRQQFQTLPTLPTPADLWVQAASLGQACRRKNFSASSLDLLIASIALHHAADVVTFDDDFQKMAAVSSLRVKLLTRPKP